MRPGAEDEGRRWLAQAERDLDDARFNLQGGRYSLACFLSQQAAEKALKAFLFAQGAEELLTHSVSRLVSEAERLDSAFGPIRRLASTLDQYYLTTRYPNAIAGGLPHDVFDEEDATRAVSRADTVLQVVRSKVPEAGS